MPKATATLLVQETQLRRLRLEAMSCHWGRITIAVNLRFVKGIGSQPPFLNAFAEPDVCEQQCQHDVIEALPGCAHLDTVMHCEVEGGDTT